MIDKDTVETALALFERVGYVSRLDDGDSLSRAAVSAVGGSNLDIIDFRYLADRQSRVLDIVLAAILPQSLGGRGRKVVVLNYDLEFPVQQLAARIESVQPEQSDKTTECLGRCRIYYPGGKLQLVSAFTLVKRDPELRSVAAIVASVKTLQDFDWKALWSPNSFQQQLILF